MGNGDTIQQFGPSGVNGGLSFRTISAGALHTCGLSTNDVAYCWGSNRFGQLGRPIERVATPTPVNGLTGVGTLALGPNSSHTCALTGTGSAFCWGNNNDAELGNNSTQPASAGSRLSLRWSGVPDDFAGFVAHVCGHDCRHRITVGATMASRNSALDRVVGFITNPLPSLAV